jgi:hypothetical protein
MGANDPLLAPVQADEHREVGGVLVDIARAGNVRVKRMIYPPGFNWNANLTSVSWPRARSMFDSRTGVWWNTRPHNSFPSNLDTRGGWSATSPLC